MQKLKIVAISGSGRTGSTLLSLLLSQHDGVFNLGQLRDLWRAYSNNMPCSCGAHLKDCSVYKVAIPAALGADPETEADRMHRMMQRFFKDAAARRDWGDTAVQQQLAQTHALFIGNLGKLLKAIQDITGASHFVDSSKSPEMALALGMITGAEVRVLNLVRDPRAVVCSWHQKLGGVKRALRYARIWRDRERRLRAWAPVLGARYWRISYEKFSVDPKAAIEAILGWAGMELPGHLFVAQSKVVVSWQRQHLFPPANERMLADKSTEILIKPSAAWRSVRNWPLHCLALLYSYPEGWRYLDEPGRS